MTNSPSPHVLGVAIMTMIVMVFSVPQAYAAKKSKAERQTHRAERRDLRQTRQAAERLATSQIKAQKQALKAASSRSRSTDHKAVRRQVHRHEPDQHRGKRNGRDSGFGLSVHVSSGGFGIGVSYTTCSRCGVRYRRGHSHRCSSVSFSYSTCGKCGVRYRHGHSHRCTSSLSISYSTCGKCGVRYRGSHHCRTSVHIAYQTCSRCGVRYRHGHSHTCRVRQVSYSTCALCGVRYSGSHHCSGRYANRYSTCGKCGVRFHLSFGHVCRSSLAVTYTRCASCGLSYRSGHGHHCRGYGTGLSLSVGYLRCGGCGISYRSGWTHGCSAAIRYTHCGSCGVRYRYGAYHHCRPATTFTTVYAAPVREKVVEVVEAPPKSSEPPAAVLDGFALLRRDKFEEAVTEFAAQSNREPDRALPHVGRSIALAMVGRDADAIEAMRAGIELDAGVLSYVPSDEALAGLIGHLAGEYRKQADAAASAPDLWFMVGTLEAARRDYAAAFAALENADRHNDEHPTTYYLRDVVKDQRDGKWKYKYRED